MAMLPEPLATQVRGFGASIPDASIFDDDGSGEHGRDDEPHITIKYGIHTGRIDEVASALEGEGPATATLRDTSVFYSEKYVVLKIGVSSQDLKRLNGIVSSEMEVTDSFPDYHPHLTVAYLRHDRKDPYSFRQYFTTQFEGVQVEFNRLLFSPAKGSRGWIELDAPMAQVASRVATAERVALDFLRSQL